MQPTISQTQLVAIYNKQPDINISMLYMLAYPQIQKIAAGCGYVVAMQGNSQSNDLSYVAVPWIEDVLSEEAFINRVLEFFEPLNGVTLEQPELKPHGRKVWAICTSIGLCFDISVMPRL